MSTKFFNNIDATLMDKFHGIASAMTNFDLFHAVVGYFRSSGYFRLRKELESTQEIKILVGINIDDLFRRHDATLFFNAHSHAPEVVESYRAGLVEEIRQAHYDADTEAGITQMFDDISTGRLQMRVVADHNLHAKFYLCLPRQHNEHSDGWVIMGSSNLSDPGLGTSESPRYELNVAMKDYDDVAFCEAEFQRLWTEAVEITAADMQQARTATHLTALQPPTPYELYMKVLINAFGHMVEDSFDLDPTHYGFLDLSYQRDAVIQGYQTMMRHGGCFIADVVGLGKTPVASMIAKRFVRENGRFTRILVIMPPAMRRAWEDTFEQLEIKKYAYFVTSGSLDKVIEARDNFREPREYDLVIVDEAHNYRHDGNDTYKRLQLICKAPRANRGNLPGTRKRVLLLSATPFNNTPLDIRNQLLLFQDARNSTIDGLGDITATFSQWIADYNALQKQRGTLPHDDFVQGVDNIMEQIRHRVLEPVMVRRTRNNILHNPNYRADLDRQGIRFPEYAPLRTKRYEMEPALADLFSHTMQLLTDTPSEFNPDGQGLHYARYRAVEFFKAGVPYKGKQGHHVALLLTGIFRTHMVKRLESSFAAFKKSLHTFLDITLGMINMFEQDKVLIAPDYNVKHLQVEQEMELDEIIEYIEHKGVDRKDFVYHADDFQPELVSMLRQDAQQLRDLCTQWDAIDYDPKLELFINMLQGELFNPHENMEGKLVVFSESVDTVTYLRQQIENRLGRTDVLTISAKNRDVRRQDIVANFDANYKGDPRNDYNIILTSDVLAEGVNLHRANVIVNYDSPWNASRLMQRGGRVNRIGSRASKIYNYMFYPSKQGDEQINLYSNALIKLQGFHSALGEDSQIFSHEEIVKEFKLFNEDIRDENDERDELMRQVADLMREQPALYERIKRLPPKSRCCRSVQNAHGVAPRSTLVFLSSERRTDYVLVDAEGRTRPLTFLDAVRVLRAAPTEMPLPLEPLRDLHFMQVGRALALYHQLQEQQESTSSMKLNRGDKVVSGALKFLRTDALAAMSDGQGRELCHKLKGLVELGTFNTLPRELAALAKAQRGASPLGREEIEQAIVELADTYCPELYRDRDSRPLNVVPDIIISETFSQQ